MTKLFYGSYAICALLALLHLVIFFSLYSSGNMSHWLIVLTAGVTSLILLASFLFPLKAKIVAVLMFAVSMIFSYAWDKIDWPLSPAMMSFSDGIIEALLFLIFVLVPILSFVSGASLLGQNSKREE